MTELIALWRRQAASEVWADHVRELYAKHADELEQAWHEHAHDGEWKPGCTICETEMANQ
jgi:hypothetical protein